MHVLTAGSLENDAILFLHGNTSSSIIWEEVMAALSHKFYCIAPDLRGYGLTDSTTLIDATRGVKDWVDDIDALAQALKIEDMHIIGHSLGGWLTYGCIAYLKTTISDAVLIAPGSPYGFSGTHGSEGFPNNEDFSGTGGGMVHPKLVELLKKREREISDPLFSPRAIMNRLFWKEGFKAEREEDFLTSMLQMHLGEKQYPGDGIESKYWPGVAPGKFGPVNAISPKYNQHLTNDFLKNNSKPPILWLHGTDDFIVSDTSLSDTGYQGKIGLRTGWPGEEVYPPQPMITQTRNVMDKYRDKGGIAIERLIKGSGHSPFIEKFDETLTELNIFLNNNHKNNTEFSC